MQFAARDSMRSTTKHETLVNSTRTTSGCSTQHNATAVLPSDVFRSDSRARVAFRSPLCVVSVLCSSDKSKELRSCNFRVRLKIIAPVPQDGTERESVQSSDGEYADESDRGEAEFAKGQSCGQQTVRQNQVCRLKC